MLFCRSRRLPSVIMGFSYRAATSISSGYPPCQYLSLPYPSMSGRVSASTDFTAIPMPNSLKWEH
ncbi:hypothetical protein PIB30_064105 [Stylosanthes scabra]|uniref:Uncharacterized protein n=1 Tax=Stylosanthes scabra TaxID=79078 RepID=A0ABU6QM38_9FABA|nr:hypothetical protein [Stylosanthes scabra]